VGDRERLAASLRHFRQVIVPQQVQPDGSCPRELARTRSMHYSLFNLDAMACLCEMARLQGEDLWRYATPDGRGIGLAISFMLPYVDNLTSGSTPRSTARSRGPLVLPTRFGTARNAGVPQVNAKRLANRYLVRGQDPLGPLAFFPGFAFPESGGGRFEAL